MDFEIVARRTKPAKHLSRRDSAKRIVKFCEYRASRLGYEIKDEAKWEIEKLALDAFQRWSFTHPELGASYAKSLQKYERSFSILVDEMVLESLHLQKFSSTDEKKLGERTVKGALARLCPFFPIC